MRRRAFRPFGIMLVLMQMSACETSAPGLTKMLRSSSPPTLSAWELTSRTCATSRISICLQVWRLTIRKPGAPDATGLRVNASCTGATGIWRRADSSLNRTAKTMRWRQRSARWRVRRGGACSPPWKGTASRATACVTTSCVISEMGKRTKVVRALLARPGVASARTVAVNSRRSTLRPRRRRSCAACRNCAGSMARELWLTCCAAPARIALRNSDLIGRARSTPSPCRRHRRRRLSSCLRRGSTFALPRASFRKSALGRDSARSHPPTSRCA